MKDLENKTEKTDLEKLFDLYSESFYNYFAKKNPTVDEVITWCKDIQNWKAETLDIEKQRNEEWIQTLDFLTEDERAAVIHNVFVRNNTYSYSDFLEQETSFDPRKDYECKIFAYSINNEDGKFTKLYRKFPIGSISYIGARPSVGKTTVMLNIVLDALKQNKNVVFCTAEETPRKCIEHLINALAYDKFKTEKNEDFSDYRDTFQNENFSPRNEIVKFFSSNKSIKEECRIKGSTERIYEKAISEIKNYMEERKLIIHTTYKSSWNDFILFLNSTKRESIVLIDYVQHLRVPNDKTQSRQVQIQMMSQQLADISASRDFIIISGAQFSRATTETKTIIQNGDNFSLECLRESGDLEQDASIVIGLGRVFDNTGTEQKKTKRYYRVLKNREGYCDSEFENWFFQCEMKYSWITSDNPNSNEIQKVPTSSTPSEKKVVQQKYTKPEVVLPTSLPKRSH